MENKEINVRVKNDFPLIGTIAAVLLSWTTWHSIGWAILHGLLGWIYVVYYIIVYML